MLVTWDRVVREAAGGITPYEAMDAAKAETAGTSQDTRELDRLLTLSPRDLTILSNDANKTYEHFRQRITISEEAASLIRVLRVDKDYSWRAVARFCSTIWRGGWEANQLAGMVICEKAAKMCEEDFMEPPWN